MLDVSSEIIYEIVNTVDMAEKIGIQVEWIDKAIGDMRRREKVSICTTTPNFRESTFEITEATRPS